VLSEDLPDERLYVMTNQWYEENRVEVRTSCQVTALNTGGKQVTLSDGSSLSYDKLILATGARSNIPPLPGTDKPGVFALRNLADAIALKAALATAKKAVVIGGGVLGLEAVWSMVSAGLEVTVVEHNNRIMPRQLDESSSERLQQLMLSKGVQLCLSADTEEILGSTAFNGIKLKDGRVLEADLVLLSTGVKPNIELASAAGLTVERGIVVDTQLRTSASDVFAAGDVAQVEDRLIGLWPVSLEMGKRSGRLAGVHRAGVIHYAGGLRYGDLLDWRSQPAGTRDTHCGSLGSRGKLLQEELY